MPLYFLRLIESCWIFGSTVCPFYNLITFHLTSTSVHNVALIAVDRYMALSNPFLYSKIVTVNLGIVVASLNWLFSFGYNFALLFDNGFFTTSLTLCPSKCLIIVNEMWAFVDLVIVLVLPCSTMFVLYLKIFAIARKHADAIRAANTQGNPNNRHTHNVPKRSERKAAKVLGILVSVFLLCLVPYYMCSLMAGSIPSDIFSDVTNYTGILFCLNSMLNPVIYALFYPWFQKSMKLILTQHVCTKDSSLMQVK
ncbi:trace amine-associated receptor 13c-like [Engraulis encrasicolus]|uniref:trace amine-associated receptor 13c-like n=1 Tax=Engraulis encrasicolus TaxID=184585 RepID=UPI002FD66878